jgi:hypothetical protein
MCSGKMTKNPKASKSFGTLTDLSTGRTYKTRPTRLRTRPMNVTDIERDGPPEGAFVLFDDAYSDILRRLPRSRVTIRPLGIAPDVLSWTEFRPLDQKDLAMRLETTPRSVNRALSALLVVNAVEQKGSGSATTWRLSMTWGWRGNAASYHAAERERAQAGQ